MSNFSRILRSASSTIGGYDWAFWRQSSLQGTSILAMQWSYLCHVKLTQAAKAWKNNMPLYFSGPRFTTISWSGNHLMDWSLPNFTQIISKPASWIVATARICASHALINTDFICCFAVWRACVKILGSASSWLQGLQGWWVWKNPLFFGHYFEIVGTQGHYLIS